MNYFIILYQNIDFGYHYVRVPVPLVSFETTEGFS
jgi:hypothetical protein